MWHKDWLSRLTFKDSKTLEFETAQAHHYLSNQQAARYVQANYVIFSTDSDKSFIILPPALRPSRVKMNGQEARRPRGPTGDNRPPLTACAGGTKTFCLHGRNGLRRKNGFGLCLQWQNPFDEGFRDRCRALPALTRGPRLLKSSVLPGCVLNLPESGKAGAAPPSLMLRTLLAVAEVSADLMFPQTCTSPIISGRRSEIALGYDIGTDSPRFVLGAKGKLSSPCGSNGTCRPCRAHAAPYEVARTDCGTRDLHRPEFFQRFCCGRRMRLGK
jgi:hypothetical protein